LSEKSLSGLIRISDDVISTIAGLAAIDTPGIVSISSSISEGLTKRLNGKNAKKGVFVEVMESETSINLRVIVNYGTNIQAICRDLQENVREAVENMTGLRVVKVNVKVESIAIKKEEIVDKHSMK